MKLAVLISVQTAFPRFMSFVMFVQGFWYGSVLVHSGKSTPGDVLTTFWACLIVTQSMAQLVQHLAALERGKIAGETLYQYICADAMDESRFSPRRNRYPNLHTEDIILKDVSSSLRNGVLSANMLFRSPSRIHPDLRDPCSMH